MKIPKRHVLAFVLALTAGRCGFAQTPTKPAGKTVAEKLGYPADSRLLIIHAEDMGMAHSIDKATFEALEKGWVTSGDAIVSAPWFPEVVRWAKGHPNADLGVRLTMISPYPLYRWRPVSSQQPGSGLLDADGYLPATQQYLAKHASQVELETEARAQIEAAKKAGIQFSHLDNFAKALILKPALFEVYWKMHQEYKVPVVLPSRQVVQRGSPATGDRRYNYGGVDLGLDETPMDGVLEIFSGYTKQDWLSVYEKSLAALGPGVYQISVHLGHDDEELQAVTGNEPQWGAAWRQNDFDVVSSPEFQKFLKDNAFILVSWKDLAKTMPE